MSSIFDKWDSSVDTEGLKKDIKEAEESNGGNYKEVPHGTYEVAVTKMELKESKKGDPMFSCWMKIVEGEYSNSLIFMNQVITQGFQIHLVNEFIKALVPDMDVHFDTYSQYNDLIMDVFEEIDDSVEYLIEYAATKKGYDSFRVKEIYPLD